MSHVLWLVKFDKYEAELTSAKNGYIPQKAYNFYSKFQELINNDNNVSLMYIATNGPYVMDRKETNLPRKDWNMTIITKHVNTNKDTISSTIKQFQSSVSFNKLKKAFNITNIYNICMNMKEDRMSFLASNKIRNKILSRSPKYPYPSASYQWFSNTDLTKIKQAMKFVKYKNIPFLMLNLMQIIDEKEDKIYSRKAGPLVWGVGGRIPIIGDASCIDNNYWTEVLLVYYPSTEAFWTMWTSKNYLDIVDHKTNSTKDVFLQMTIPIYCHPKWITHKNASKL